MENRFSSLSKGKEWIVDARGCSPEALKSVDAVLGLLGRAVEGMGLNVVGAPLVHAFPGPGGVTALFLLSESHLSCHTFPETGYCAIDLYCCRPRPEWDWTAQLARHLGATSVQVRSFDRSAVQDAAQETNDGREVRP